MQVKRLTVDLDFKPWTVIENIPSHWVKIDVAIYHGYGVKFEMDQFCYIKVKPMTEIRRTTPWKQLSLTRWPLDNWSMQPKDKIIREHIATVTIPTTDLSGKKKDFGTYALRFEMDMKGLKALW